LIDHPTAATAGSPTDTVQRFLLEGAAVRGEIVSLDAAWREVTSRHAYPRSVRDRLGELCAAGLLLSASLKFDGALILQIHGDGPVALLVAECEADGRFRATAKLREGYECPDDASLAELVNANGKGRFVVTLDPRNRTAQRQPYQGIVPFEGDTIAQVLERYMDRSEQVPTRLWLAADDARATGLMLQRLASEGGRPATVGDEAPSNPVATEAGATAPSVSVPDRDGWTRLQILAETLTGEELLSLPSAQVLRRLFWQEPLHAFDARPTRFACTCSRTKVSAMLKMLGREEVDDILREQRTVSVRCEYCNTPYDFDAVDSAELFVSEPLAPASNARH
jgi:molecular chaperone Hsp33